MESKREQALVGLFVVVASAHHVKLFDLSRSESHLYSLDGKDVGLKELKVTSCEFRPAMHPADNGFILWMGTKDGHLLELDIRTMSVIGTKFVAHSHQVMYIFRHGRSMVPRCCHAALRNDSRACLRSVFSMPALPPVDL